MTPPHVSFSVLDAGGTEQCAWRESREYYAASTVKVAVAAALLFAIEAGTHTLAETVQARRRFSSRIDGAPVFEIGADEGDPGMPPDGTPVTLDWCLTRMIAVSSNEATNLIVEALGRGDDAAAGVRGLEAVREACDRLGVPGVRVTRLICDYPAKLAGFTHATSAHDLARLLRSVTCGTALSAASRDRLWQDLSNQQFPIIAAVLPEALPGATRWGSKSGWDDAIRHDVTVLLDDPARTLAICTEGYSPQGAHELIRVLATAVLSASPRGASA